MKKLLQKTKRWGNLFHCVVKISPGLFFAEYLVSGIYGVSLAFTPLCLECIFDAIAKLARHEILPMQMLPPILILLAVNIISEIAAGMSDYFGETYADLAGQKLYSQINKKIGTLPAIDFENTETLNLMNKSYEGAYSVRGMVHTVMDLLTMYLPYIVVYAWYLYRCRPILPVALIIIFAPIAISQMIKKKSYAQLEDESAPLRRRREHLAECIASKEYIVESRGLGAQPFLFQKYRAVQDDLNRHIMRIEKKNCKVDTVCILINALGFLGVIFLLLESVSKQYIELGSFVAVFASIRTAYQQIDEVVNVRAGELSSAVVKVNNYLRFCELPEEECQNETMPTIQHIRINDISFQYPNGKDALHNISFDVERGDLIAIVGENGSGKTTLAKILAGIYSPTNGSVTYDDGRHSNYEVRSVTSQLFQKYSRYRMTLEENVTISSKQTHRPLEIISALAAAHIDPNGLPDGLDTNLGREFGGTELSGGQWQRVALARAVYRPCQVIIFDEPTAAMDPNNEAELYHSFAESSADKFGFIITHRLGIVKLCQKVLVLKDGQFVDFGSHEDVLSRCEYYRQLWTAQAEQHMGE